LYFGLGGASAGGCFNCGQNGHKSFECPDPKKARPSSGFSGRGGASAGGFKRSFTGNRDNGYNAGGTNNKKIKFGDDDD
jgi:hypothetical protein